jgi:general secretion pathway protein G
MHVSTRRLVLAWTLIEVTVALVVVSLLAAIAGPLYRGYQERARVGTAVSDIGSIVSRVNVFRTEFGQFPAALDSVYTPVPLDPWGSPYQYLKIEGAPPGIRGQVRKDKNLVPLNTDFDLYSMGPDGQSQAPLTAPVSLDDVVRANDGGFLGRASDY